MQARHHARGAGELLGAHPGRDPVEVVGAGADRHHDLLERGVAGALAEPVDRALDLARAVRHAGQRVRDRQAEVVVAVGRDDEVAPHAVDHVPDELAEVLGQPVADGVGDVDRGRAVVHRDLAHVAHEVGVRAEAVLGRVLDVRGVALGPGHARRDLLLDLVVGHPELLLHVELGRRQEDVDPVALGVAHRLPRPVHVLERGPGEPRDDRAAHGLGDRLDGFEVTVAGDREAGLDDVDPEARELVGDLELLADVQRDAGRLLAVPEGRVEDQDLVHRSSFWSVLAGRFGIRQTKFATNKKPLGPEGTRGFGEHLEALAPT